MLGIDQQKDLEWCTFRIGVQFAYSFDGGASWVNDMDEDPESLYYEPPRSFDLDEDGIEEYVELPSRNIEICQLYNTEELFDGRYSPFYAAYKDDAAAAKEIIDIGEHGSAAFLTAAAFTFGRR